MAGGRVGGVFLSGCLEEVIEKKMLFYVIGGEMEVLEGVGDRWKWWRVSCKVVYRVGYCRFGG